MHTSTRTPCFSHGKCEMHIVLTWFTLTVRHVRARACHFLRLDVALRIKPWTIPNRSLSRCPSSNCCQKNGTQIMCGHVGVASVVNRLQAAKSIKKPECANLILGSSSYSLSCLLGVLVCNYVSSVGFPTLLKPTTKQIWGAASFSLRTRMNYSGYYQPDIPKIWATTVARVLFHTGANGTVHPCDLGPGWKSGAGSWGKFVQGHVEPKSMMYSAKKGLFLELQVQIALTFWRFL